MGYAVRELPYYLGDSKEAQSKRIILSLSSPVPDAQKGEATCLPRPPLLWEPHKTEWKSANLSGVTVGNILVVQGDDELD